MRIGLDRVVRGRHQSVNQTSLTERSSDNGRPRLPVEEEGDLMEKLPYSLHEEP